MSATRSALPRRRLLPVLLLCAGLAACQADPGEMLQSAQEYYAKHDYNAAAIQLKNVLQKQPDNAEARFLLGAVSLDQGDVAGAVRDLTRALDLGIASTQVAPLLARARVLNGEYDAVLDTYADSALTNPVDQAIVLASVGDALLARERFDEARQYFERALQSNPKEMSAYIGLGRLDMAAGKVREALAQGDKAIVADATSPAGHALRGDALLALGQSNEAVTAYEEALRLAPGAVNVHLALISLLVRGGDLDGATARLPAMQKVAPDAPATLYLQALVNYYRNQPQPAREAIDRLLAMMPDNPSAQLLAGAIYIQVGNQLQAQRYLESALQRLPDNPTARRLLASSLLASGEAARARTLLEPLADSGADANTLTLAGQAFLAAGDPRQATAYFSRAVASNPQDAAAHTRLAVARMTAGETDRALAELEKAAQLDGSSGEPDVALVLAHMRARDYDKALAAQQQLEQKQPDNPHTYNLKGGILLGKGDQAGARAAFARALELRADFLPAAVNLARLDLAAQKPRDAYSYFEKIIKAYPAQFDAYLLLAELQTAGGEAPETVRATLERAQKANPNANAPKLALARFHLSQREVSQALQLARSVTSISPEDPVAHGVLAQALFASGDTQQALVAFNRVVELQPKAVQPLTALADFQYANKDVATAEQTLRRALKLEPDAFEAQKRLFSLLGAQGKIDAALGVVREMQQQRPHDGRGFAFEGDLEASRNRWNDAVRAYRKAFELAPLGEFAIKLHSAQTRAGQGALADQQFEVWRQANPHDAAALGYAAERALAAKRLDEANRLYRELLAMAPNNVIVLNNLAWIGGETGQNDAMALAERALKLAPDNAGVLDTVGVLKLKAGDTEGAIAALRSAVQHAPQVAAMRLNLARAYAQAGRKDEARKLLDEIIKAAGEGDNPLKTEARRVLETL